MTSTLKIKKGPQAGFEKQIDRGDISIGRDPACDLVLDDIEISRYHARIFLSGSEFFIEDLNSTNGTFLNGRPVKKQETLKNGDRITLGESIVLEFASIDPEPSVHQALNGEIESGISTEEQGFSSERQERKTSTPSSAAGEIPYGKEKLLNKLPSWMIILVIALAFLVFFCFIPFVIIEAGNQWCNLFSGFFNALSPGACP